MPLPSLTARPSDDHLTFRGFHDKADFEAIAQLRNRSVAKHQGDDAAASDARLIERTVSTPERLRMAEIDQEPVGFIFVARPGGPQLDEFGTIEGKSWLFIGPTCVPEWEGKGIEKALLDWLITHARKTSIARLIKFIRAAGTPESVIEVLAEVGFRERLRYYFMRLEMTAAPPTPRELPSDLELVDFGVERGFDALWSVLEPAFDYVERDAGSYEQEKALFESMRSAYIPICLEAASGKPVGTIALVPHGDRGIIATFGVIPSFQGRGIGSQLMARAIDHAWRSGIRTIDLSVRIENPRAIGVYRRFGFQSVPERTTIVLLREDRAV